jgi:flagellar assembly factor FliW
VDLYNTINFPRCLIGYEESHNVALLQIREGAPLLILQSMEDPDLGLLVADPYAFVPEYSLRVGDAEQKLLKVASAADLAILVTATIPPGRPAETALNLLGPILINHKARLGIQVPQVEGESPSRVFVHKQRSGSPENS